MTRNRAMAILMMMFLAAGIAAASGGEAGAEGDLDALIQKRYERVSIAHLPTPFEEMPSLAEALGGPPLYIKRDDQTGLAFGGNKARKLDFIFADVLAKKADVVVTWAGVQSNWARQTAAASRMFGIDPILVLAKNGISPTTNGNLLLDAILDAEVHVLERGSDLRAVVEELVAREEAKGRTVYSVPVGGSRPDASMEEPLGAIAYAYGFEEMWEQAKEQGKSFRHVVVATGSGGTQAGLMVGAKAIDPDIRILGIAVSTEKGAVKKNVAEIANITAEALGLDLTFTPEETIVIDDYLGDGYGHLSEPIMEGMRLVATHEGVLIDPVYTGKAMAGMIDLIRKGQLPKDEGVVFLHTGGTPALFAYETEILHNLNRNK